MEISLLNKDIFVFIFQINNKTYKYEFNINTFF